MSAQEPNTPKLVRDLMTVGVASCAPEMTLEELAQAFSENQLEAAVVLDAGGHAVGMITPVELLQAFSQDMPLDTHAEEVMNPEVPSIPPDIPLKAAAQLMLDQGRRAFFITHHAGGIEYPAAVITFQHFLRLISSQDPEALRDLGIKAQRKPPIETFYERREAARKRNLSSLFNDEE